MDHHVKQINQINTMMKQRWGLDRNVLRPTPGDPWGVEQHHWNTGATENHQLNPVGPSNRQKKLRPKFKTVFIDSLLWLKINTDSGLTRIANSAIPGRQRCAPISGHYQQSEHDSPEPTAARPLSQFGSPWCDFPGDSEVGIQDHVEQWRCQQDCGSEPRPHHR